MSTTDNAQLVVSFYEQAFNDGQPQAAAARALGETYTQHNPGAQDGPDAFVATPIGCAGSSPTCTSTSSASSPTATSS